MFKIEKRESGLYLVTDGNVNYWVDTIDTANELLAMLKERENKD